MKDLSFSASFGPAVTVPEENPSLVFSSRKLPIFSFPLQMLYAISAKIQTVLLSTTRTTTHSMKKSRSSTKWGIHRLRQCRIISTFRHQWIES
jgi:hypothetical protein